MGPEDDPLPRHWRVKKGENMAEKAKRKVGRPKGSKNKVVVKKEKLDVPRILMTAQELGPEMALGALSKESAAFVIGCVDPKVVSHEVVSGSAGLMGLRITLSHGDVETEYKVHGTSYHGRQEKLRNLHPQAEMKLVHSPVEGNPYNVYVVEGEETVVEYTARHKKEIRIGAIVLTGLVALFIFARRALGYAVGIVTGVAIAELVRRVLGGRKEK